MALCTAIIFLAIYSQRLAMESAQRNEAFNVLQQIFLREQELKSLGGLIRPEEEEENDKTVTFANKAKNLFSITTILTNNVGNDNFLNIVWWSDPELEPKLYPEPESEPMARAETIQGP